MSNCDEFQKLRRKMASGELMPDEAAKLRDHARLCSECSSFLQVEESLSRCGTGIEIPLDDLERVRYKVLRSIAVPARSGLANRLPGARRRFFARASFAWGMAAAMLVFGVFFGYFWKMRRDDEGSAWVRQIYSESRKTRNFSDVENSPLIYSNVSFEPAGNNELALSFDATVHVDLTSAKDDPLVKDVLIQALLNPSPVGARLKAVSFAETVKDPEVKQALIISMLNDPSVAVRLKVQSILLSYRNDREIQSAFLQVLRKDESVRLRLQALDYLVGNNINREVLREAVRDLRSPYDTAVLHKAMPYIQ